MTAEARRIGNWKPSKMASRVAAHRKRQETSDHETREKAKVRRGDPGCRFPRCVCRRLGLALAVAHLNHKGSGGNPTGDRSLAHLMIRLCSARHRESYISLDGETVSIIPMSSDGTRGPCRWFVDIHALDDGPTGTRPAKWVAIGVERSRGVFELFTPKQVGLLDRIERLAA